MVVFLWWCTKYYSSTTNIVQSTTPSTTNIVQSTTSPYYKVLLQYYSVLQSTTPVLQGTTPYYKVLLQYYFRTTKYYSSTTKYYSVLQSTTPVLLRTTELPVLRTTPSTTKASKTSISCEASSKFHRTSFQNERFARCFRQFFTEKSFQKDRFVRGFLQISQKKLPKRAFRAMLLPKFTEQVFKTSVSCDASDNFHTKKLPK